MPALIEKLTWQVKQRLGYQTALVRAEIERSGYFHPEWYLATYPELLNDPSAVNDPLGYFLTQGIQQGHNPGPGFHTQWYLDEYDDVRQAAINPLLHYLRFGREEDRRPTPFLGGIQEMLHQQGGAGQHRVIYKSRRSADLSHIGRVKRLNKIEGVQAWREFSQAFQAQSSSLAQGDAEYLHNRGFLPSRKRLYGLPNTRIDAYLSDLQAMLIAQTNGAAQSLLASPVLQWQLYHRRVPMLPQGVQPGVGPRLKTLLMVDPAGAGLIPLAAVVTKQATAATVGMALSMQLALKTGSVNSVARYHHSVVVGPRKALPWETYRYKAMWQLAKGTILAEIQKEALYAFVQVDIDLSSSTPQLIQLAGLPSVEDFQVHGPLMRSQSAIDFMREFGI